MGAIYGVEVDQAGVAEFLHSSEVTAAVRELAEQVAQAARGQGHRVDSGGELPIEVFDDPGSDRPGATVAVRHPAGVGMEARHGVLKRSAESVGLEVDGLEPDVT